MQMSDRIHIAAPRERVFAALNDPDVLRASIPGCETLEKTSDSSFKATVTTKIGPVKAKFNGEVTLSDLDPPNGYTISGEGKGGAAGFAKGGATVRLEDADGGTMLNYDVKADVGGKLAQLGSRLIDGTARSLAKDFFATFKQQVEGPPLAADQPVSAPAPSAEAAGGINWIVVAAAAVVIVAFLVLLVR